MYAQCGWALSLFDRERALKNGKTRLKLYAVKNFRFDQ